MDRQGTVVEHSWDCILDRAKCTQIRFLLESVYVLKSLFFFLFVKLFPTHVLGTVAPRYHQNQLSFSLRIILLYLMLEAV
jgi:hypothetical protein